MRYDRKKRIYDGVMQPAATWLRHYLVGVSQRDAAEQKFQSSVPSAFAVVPLDTISAGGRNRIPPSLPS